jgi:hypothetical protein
VVNLVETSREGSSFGNAEMQYGPEVSCIDFANEFRLQRMDAMSL